MKAKTYNPTLDLLRIIAICAVVAIHTTTRTLEASHFDLVKLPLTLFLNQAFRFAVPMFFMISGFVLELTYKFHKNYALYLKKRVQRIFVPYVFWSAIYYFLLYTNHTENFFQSLLNGDSSYQLYFIPALLIFYVLFPFFHNIFKVIANKWTLILLAILQILLLYYDYSIKPLFLYYPLKIALLNYYVFLLGIFASRHQEEVLTFLKKWSLLFGVVTAALAYYIYFQGKTLYLATHNYLSFYSQWRPSVFIYTISLSGFLYAIFDKHFLKSKLIKLFARLSFFVFFIHVIILELVWRTLGVFLMNQTHGKIIQQLFWDPAFFLTVAAISFLISYIIHRLPYLSKITG